MEWCVRLDESSARGTTHNIAPKNSAASRRFELRIVSFGTAAKNAMLTRRSATKRKKREQPVWEELTEERH